MPASALDAASSPFLIAPTGEIALVGVRTPLSGGLISGPAAPNVAVRITATTGTLAADLLPEVTVSGGGSDTLWIAGPLAQVNAALATLAYVAPAVGADVMTVTLANPLGQNSGPASVPITILPLITPASPTPPVLKLAGGTLTLESRQIDGVTLDIDDANNGAGAATVVLTDTTLGENVTLAVTTSDVTSPAPRVAIAGQVEWDGAAAFEAGPALVTIAQNAVLVNHGRIDFVDSWAQVSGAGTLQNDGTLTIASGPAGRGPAIDVAISGAGVIRLGAGSQVELGAPVAADETIRFQSNTGALVLGAPVSMQGLIAGFVAGDTIQLDAIEFDAADYTQAGDGGSLTLYDGSQVETTLHFAGTHQLSDFVFSVSTDSATDGGAITTLSVRAFPAAAVSVAGDASTDVYRFFDSANGTQLLTQDPGERDTILASRPDLVFEGTAMRAVTAAASDPAATAVYRFFETADGTHFFTASETERNSLLASRPDLIFEPNSTMLEDASPQPGDVPVYRFFDALAGTHFFTDSASERASILATQPDMKGEGIAFYTPGR